MNPPSVNQVKAFYDRLASEYDLMTMPEERSAREEPFYKSVIGEYHITTALDAGCGTGFHAILLSQLKVRVTAADVSGIMLSVLRERAHKKNLEITTVQSSFSELSQKVHTRFDAILCTGNTLAHLLTAAELRNSLESFFTLLNPSGILLIQIVNYDRILAAKDKVQNERQAGGMTFIRSYSYQEGKITFSIEIKPSDQPDAHSEKISVELMPLRSSELINALKESGFGVIGEYGGIAKEPYRPDASQDFIVIARKTA